MLVKILCMFASVGVVFCASIQDYKGDEIPFPFYELPCSSLGGLCLQKNECPEGKQVGVTGLCPQQQDQGVECCYSVAKSDNTCRSRGGECMDSSSGCKERQTFSQASDCGKHEKCCILLK